MCLDRAVCRGRPTADGASGMTSYDVLSLVSLALSQLGTEGVMGENVVCLG